MRAASEEPPIKANALRILANGGDDDEAQAAAFPGPKNFLLAKLIVRGH